MFTGIIEYYYSPTRNEPSILTNAYVNKVHRNQHRPRKISPFSFFIVAAFLLACSQTVFSQTTYYVANSGNDSNGGRSADNPLQSLNKVNSLILHPGDQVLFRRGDTFRGTLNIRQSGNAGQPIVIDAFGSGNKPVLAGSVVVSNWTNIGNNTWQANVDLGSRITGVYKNGTALPLGRYPNLDATNRGYLTVQSHSGKTQLTSRDGLGTNWTGGEIVVRATQWILDRAYINGQNGNTLNLNNNSGYDIADGFGFFIQNHPATLDQVGEWYYNPGNKTLRMYDGSDPNGQTITATINSEAVNLTNVSYVTLRNLQLTQAMGTNLLINSGSNITVSSIDVTNAGEDGVLIQGGGNTILVENSLIQDVNNNGFAMGGYQNFTFRGNTVQRIGLVPGRGKSGDGTYTGFQSASNANTLIENNVIDQIGYSAVNFANNTVIQRNRISNFTLTKSDGGGLYIWNGNHQGMSGVRLLNNIVFNGIGTSEGTPGGAYSGANGIYLDDCTANVEVTGNSVFNCKGLGIFLHGSSSVQVKNNTSYNNGEAQLSMTSIANSCSPYNNVVQNNVFVSRTADQLVAKYESHLNDLNNYGQYSNNVYARPFNDNNKIRIVYGNNGNLVGADKNLSDWQSWSAQDGGSLNSPITYNPATQSPDTYLRFEYNDTGNDKIISLGGNYRDARNVLYTVQITIPAYSSVVLLKDGSSPPVVAPLRDPENPANAVVGLDYTYYEGTWGQVSDLSGVTPIKSGQTGQPDLSQRNREENFGLKFTGYINVPTDGQYTFYTYSDDGSKLYIGTTQVVDNDFGHAEQERSGTIGLKAGRHAITIPYLQGGGGKALSVSLSGPGIGKQVIPASFFFRVGASSPLPASNLRDPENPANAVNGLNYGYYEGGWSQLPDFKGLTPIRQATAGQADLTTPHREDQFGLNFTGYVNVPSDGQYTFYTYSDDGSKLYIGTTQVVDNDGGHPEQERSGTIGLKAGKHAITIPYFEGGGGQTLAVSYSGPGVAKQVIPASAFFRVSTPTTPTPPVVTTNAGTGLRGEYFNNKTLSAPSVLTRTDATIDFDWGTGTPASGTVNVDNFSVRWTGQVEAPVSGNYVFTTIADDGVRVWVNNALVIDNWNDHAPTTDNSKVMALVAGQKYSIRVEYYESAVGAVARLGWSYPGVGTSIIPQTRLYPAASGGRLASANEPAVGLLTAEVTNRVEVYPVPAQQALTVGFWASEGGEAALQLTNLAGLVVLQQSRPHEAGDQVFSVSVGDVQRGYYLLTLVHNGQRSTHKVLLVE